MNIYAVTPRLSTIIYWWKIFKYFQFAYFTDWIGFISLFPIQRKGSSDSDQSLASFLLPFFCELIFFMLKFWISCLRRDEVEWCCGVIWSIHHNFTFQQFPAKFDLFIQSINPAQKMQSRPPFDKLTHHLLENHHNIKCKRPEYHTILQIVSSFFESSGWRQPSYLSNGVLSGYLSFFTIISNK